MNRRGGGYWAYVQVGVCGSTYAFSFLFFLYIYFVVMGNAAMQNRGRWSLLLLFLFLGNILIRVEIEDGGRKAKVGSGWLGKEVAWET